MINCLVRINQDIDVAVLKVTSNVLSPKTCKYSVYKDTVHDKEMQQIWS